MKSELRFTGHGAMFAIGLSCLMVACSSSDEIDKSYMDAPQVKPITMPKGLSAPANKIQLTIPHEDTADNGIEPERLQIPPPLQDVIELSLDSEKTEKTSTAASGNRGTAKPKLKKMRSRVVTQPEGFEILEVFATTDDVWPAVQQAFQFYGYHIDDVNEGRKTYIVSREYRQHKPMDDPRKFDYDPSVPKEKYSVVLVETSGNTQLTMRNDAGEVVGSALARQLLVQLKNYFADPPAYTDTNEVPKKQ
ncbi:MAG: outer membrane protein assembly factor BamC [Gammaproteobacteria bacterium]|nr:outer membrane protein assembly factor BamC [Gammaproteobacteria bacterium]MDH5801841.1 outer membrane protein assembly factor BamC [Gammaproteobacteria bacterium]